MCLQATLLTICLPILYFGFTVTVPAAPRTPFKVNRDPRIPTTSFSCAGRTPGYYADAETGCQVYHMCDVGARQYTYICPNTTLFHQRMLICAHWYQVNCNPSENDFNPNLLIGQKDKPFVEEDFWKHKFGGAGNINFPPQEYPIKSVQTNDIHGTGAQANQQNLDYMPSSTFQTPTPQQRSPSTPETIVQTQNDFRFAQTTRDPQQKNTYVSQTPSPNQIPVSNIQKDFNHPSTDFEVSTQTPSSDISPQEVSSSNGKPFTRVLFQYDNKLMFHSSNGDEVDVQHDEDIQPPSQSPNSSSQQDFKQLATNFEAPEATSSQQASSGGNDQFTRVVFQYDGAVHAHVDDSKSQNAQSFYRPDLEFNKPSLELEPPVLGARTSMQTIIVPNMRENPTPGSDEETTLNVAETANVPPPKQNLSLDERFTQVFILPTGKQPSNGPFEHPDLVKNKLVFTDWNSLHESSTEDIKIDDINEYVNGKVPSEEPQKTDQEKMEKSSDDLQREFTSHVPRPFSFRPTPSTEIYSVLPSIQSEVRVPLNNDVFLQNKVGTNSAYQPSLELLPPLEKDEISFQTQNSFNSPSNTQSSDVTPQINDDSTSFIENPFKHPFYKVRKMNDNRNIIFLPLTDSELAFELVKVPLNGTRDARGLQQSNTRFSGNYQEGPSEE